MAVTGVFLKKHNSFLLFSSFKFIVLEVVFLSASMDYEILFLSSVLLRLVIIRARKSVCLFVALLANYPL